MISHTVWIAAMLATVGALASLGYYALCLWSALKFLRVRRTGEKASGSIPSFPLFQF